MLGGLYAVIGIGMSIVFGIMGLTNLAHGDLVIVGTFLCMSLAAQFGGNLFLSLGLTAILMVLIGFILQKYLVNKVLDKGTEPALIATFSISICMANLLLLLFGADARSIQTPIASTNIVDTAYFSISAVYFLDFVTALVVIAALHYLLGHTYFGRAIRAASGDAGAAELMGVDTKKTYSYAMCLSMLTAAIAGMLVGMTFVFYPSTGTQYLIIAFAVVVIGGMGSLAGTLVGGVVLGLAQLLGAYFFGVGYQLLCGYLVLLILLTVKPEGLLSTAVRK